MIFDEIIKLLPDILRYFVPGFIFVFLYTNLSRKKNKDYSSMMYLIASATISYITVSLVESITGKPTDEEMLSSVLLCIIIDAIAAVIAAFIRGSDLFKEIAWRAFGISWDEGTIYNTIDWNNGSNARVYVKNEDVYYFGHFEFVDDDKENGWIALSAPTRYSLDHKVLESNGDNTDIFIVIPLSDVKYIKIIN